jgi:hypothetical protein
LSDSSERRILLETPTKKAEMKTLYVVPETYNQNEKSLKTNQAEMMKKKQAHLKYKCVYDCLAYQACLSPETPNMARV